MINLVYAFVQARMGSTRLPGKVLKEICGKPLLELELERIQESSKIDKIIVTTTINKEDDSIIGFCEKKNIDHYRGSESDVLDRYYQTSKYYGVNKNDIIVRLTGDCPLIDPNVIDEVIELFMNSKTDYASNIEPPTYPDGLDVEVFGFSVLKKAWEEAQLPSEREHVTPYIRNNPNLFKKVNLKNKNDLSDYRWTVDEKEDYKFVKKIYNKLYKEDKYFSTEQIIDFIKSQPNIVKINEKFERNEGYNDSLKQDKQLLD